jgi:hypothetical protein
VVRSENVFWWVDSFLRAGTQTAASRRCSKVN